MANYGKVMEGESSVRFVIMMHLSANFLPPMIRVVVLLVQERGGKQTSTKGNICPDF